MSGKSDREIMNLPAGFTCSDCFAFGYCRALGITTADRTQCDYAPSRFSPSQELVLQLKHDLERFRKQIPPLPV